METPLFRARTAAVHIRTALKRKPLRGANSDSIPTPHGDTPASVTTSHCLALNLARHDSSEKTSISPVKSCCCVVHTHRPERRVNKAGQGQTLQLLMPRSHPALCSEGGRDHGLQRPDSAGSACPSPSSQTGGRWMT